MKRSIPSACPELALLAIGACALIVHQAVGAERAALPTPWTLQARVVAVGLPAVQGVRQVGRFHFGGPIPGNPEFLMQTQTGHVLDPERVLVALGHNLGAAHAEASHAPGTVLSIDVSAPGTLVVPQDLAAPGRAEDTRLRLYTAQTSAFANARHNPGARTAPWTAASGPRYLSINNAFGRPWIANAPLGPGGSGSLSVVDPDGAPLANAPSAAAGGVFVGQHTARESAPRAVRTGLRASWFNHRKSPQFTPGGLNTGALGTAFLGPSPDGSGFAVFAAVTADGAIVQAHVQDGVDGLAPPGTIAADGSDPGVLGMAFKWNPLPALFVTDPLRNRLVMLHLAHDERHFTLAKVSALTSPAFAAPADVAAAVPEIANPRFASHTTLAGGSDLFVANRGDGTLVRVDEQGRVRARARITLPDGTVLGAGRIRAIAVSADAQRIWLTLTGEAPGHPALRGALIEVPAFDAVGPFFTAPGKSAGDASGAAAVATSAREAPAAEEGAKLFAREFDAGSGLGPLFNATSCLSCHSQPGPGGMSSNDAHFAQRIARLDPRSGRVLPMAHGPVAHRQALQASAAGHSSTSAEFPRQANIVSLRMPPALYGVARLDEIPDEVIEAEARAKGDGIKGRVNRARAPDGTARVGRYGWKAEVATLDQMVADALANEMGVLSTVHGAAADEAEDDGRIVRALTAFLRTLRKPGAPQP